MARIQVLELPLVTSGPYSMTPFVLIIDQCDADGPRLPRTHNGQPIRTAKGPEEEAYSTMAAMLQEQTTATAVMVTAGTLDMPIGESTLREVADQMVATVRESLGIHSPRR